MLDPQRHNALRTEIEKSIARDMRILARLRDEVKPLQAQVRRIMPRATTSFSLVGTDGGNNRIRFDPFLVQLVRVVDSSNNEYCLEAVTPTTSVTELSRMQFDEAGRPRTPIGEMMDFLGVRDLTELSHMIRRNDDDRPSNPSWVRAYRELMEWGVLFSILRHKEFGTDTIIVRDGLLRSVFFAGDLFSKLRDGFNEALERQWRVHRRRVYLVGVAKHSKVLDRYRLAMALEGVLTVGYPAYVPIPRELEDRAYTWAEYVPGDDRADMGGTMGRSAAGKMFFAKFGAGSRDPIWPIDIFLPQERVAHTILGCLLADANVGFPVPFYPRCLQRAHENAALVEFDFDILQNEIFNGLRAALGAQGQTLDEFQLQDADPARGRY